MHGEILEIKHLSQPRKAIPKKTEKKIIQQAFREKKISRGKFIHDMENSDSHIANITRDMRKLGLESMVYDKAAKRFNYFGKPYGPDVDKQFEGMLADIPKTYLLRNPPYSVSKGFDKSKREYWQKPIGHAKGGLIKKGIKKLMPGESLKYDIKTKKLIQIKNYKYSIREYLLVPILL